MPSLIFFEVGPQNLAIKSEYITEIIRSVSITALPELAPPFAGVINYRGKVVPVIRLKDFPGFTSHSTELTEYMIIIEDGSPAGISLVVDQVTAFKTVEELQPVNDLDNFGYQSRLTAEIVKLDSELVPVLEVSALSKPATTVLAEPKIPINDRLA